MMNTIEDIEEKEPLYKISLYENHDTVSMKNSWKFLKKLKIDPAILLLGIYTKKMNSVYKRYLHSHVSLILFTISKLWNQPRCLSTDE
jgi:hypothetical protein